MKRNLQGRYLHRSIGGENFKCFVPQPLPPTPAIKLDAGHWQLIERALPALGRLDAISTLLPDHSLFLYFYVRKEALLSSQIEGTQSSLSDLLLHETGEMPGVPLDDVQEVSRYVAAMQYGLGRLKEGFPLCLRLLDEIHGILLRDGRGSEKTPGAYRTMQNWIGGTRPGNAVYVGPPADEVLTCMGQLEDFIRDKNQRTPILIKAALAHAQFETIHPYQDGNGRLGRLLITFLLCAEQTLTEPLLYLSLFLKTHRERYYQLLQDTRVTGDWEEWLRFFLEGVATTAEQASQTAARIRQLFENDKQRIALKYGGSSGTVLRVHDALSRRPLRSIPQTADELNLSPPTVASCFGKLESLELLREITGKPKNRLYAYSAYLAILGEGTEPVR